MRLLEMTADERAIAEAIGSPFVKVLPDGGYLALTPQILTCAVHRSARGDLAGWCEEWMFRDAEEAVMNLLLRLEGVAPRGWTRHVWMDESGASRREKPARLAAQAQLFDTRPEAI